MLTLSLSLYLPQKLMAHLVEDITKHFQFEDVDIDCWTFKLYSKGCVILFFAGSMVGVMSQYFGEPIQCDFKVSTECVNSSVTRFGQVIVGVPQAGGPYYSCCAAGQEENCKRFFDKNFSPNLESELLTHSVQWL